MVAGFWTYGEKFGEVHFWLGFWFPQLCRLKLASPDLPISLK